MDIKNRVINMLECDNVGRELEYAHEKEAQERIEADELYKKVMELQDIVESNRSGFNKQWFDYEEEYSDNFSMD